MDAVIVEECAEVFVAVDEGDDAGAGLAVVGFAVVPAAFGGEDAFEVFGDLVDAVGEQARKAEVAEGFEEVVLRGSEDEIRRDGGGGGGHE